jgi:DNA-3-methyladenine glycosylase II
MLAVERFVVEGPYDLSLSLQVSEGFSPDLAEESSLFRIAVRVDDAPVLVEVEQVEQEPPALEMSSGSTEWSAQLRQIAEWVLFADLDLTPFYQQVDTHSVLGPIVERLEGLKPIRPPSLFEMAVTAVTEQQISMAAAYRIRWRLVDAFGDRPPDAPENVRLVAFPKPERLAGATLEELQSCGLSRRKAEYINGLATAIADGELDLERLRGMSNDEARAFITQWRGFGPWSADYIMVRGLGRPDCVPADDLAVRTVVGEYLGDGSRMTADQVRQALAPFKPYRGLAAFYLLGASQV